MKHFYLLLIMAGLSVVNAHGQVAQTQYHRYQQTFFYNGDGDIVVRLQTPPLSYSNRKNDSFLVTDESKPRRVVRGLGGGGDTVWRDGAGRVRLRKTLIGGMTFYPDQRPKGIPVLAYSTTQSRDFQYQTLDDWAKIYPYPSADINDESVRKNDQDAPIN